MVIQGDPLLAPGLRPNGFLTRPGRSDWDSSGAGYRRLALIPSSRQAAGAASGGIAPLRPHPRLSGLRRKATSLSPDVI
jgi:hypothetical protein